MRKITLIVQVVSIVLSLLSCDSEQIVFEEPYANPFTIDSTEVVDPIEESTLIMYVIPEGSHYANQSGYRPISTKHLKFTAVFDSSAVYKTKEVKNQADLNKLYGIADCASQHHVNSVRFTWRWFDESLQIWAYTYVDSQRSFTLIDSVPLNTFNTYEIICNDAEYELKVNNVSVTMPRAMQRASGRV